MTTVERRTVGLPFWEFVVKVHGRCNLRCSYCYMYELADQTAVHGTAVMSSETFDVVRDRIADHVRAHRLPEVRVVLHGGEPLLVGARRLAEMADALRSGIGSETRVQIVVQTNGVLLSRAAIETLGTAEVRIGVSLDGPRDAHNRHRIFANGRGSFDAVERGLNLLRGRRDLYAGILSVIDLRNDPIETFETIRRFDPPSVDVMLPLANWDSPAPGLGQGTPYADWLIALFQHWYDDPRTTIRIRFFEQIIRLLTRRSSTTESVGLSAVATIVIAPDGAYEQIDTLRSAYEGAVGTGMTIFSHTVDGLREHPAIIARQQGIDGLPTPCRACPVRQVCGGGYYPHRYSAANGFDNRSVYCRDLQKVIRYVAGRLRADVARIAALRSDQASPDEGRWRHVPHDGHIRLSQEQFRSLAHGYGDEATVRVLQSGQHTRRLLELNEIRKLSTDAVFHDHYAVLLGAHRARPAVLLEMLADPHAGAWLATTLRALRGGPSADVDLGYFAGMATVAAVRAEIDFSTVLHPVDGMLVLPGLGALAVPEGASVRVLGQSGRAMFGDVAIHADGTSADARWRTPYILRAEHDGLALSVRLEDLDPLRGHHGHKPAACLSPSDAGRWQELLDEAWRVLVSHHRAYAEAIAPGLRVIVPLETTSRRLGINATSMTAFGAVSLTSPADALGLALGLLHEWQHAKLGALLDLVELYERDDAPRFYAPWRDDPRPLGAALQGIFAFLGVTDFWRVQRGLLTEKRRSMAEVEFARWRDRVWRTFSDLERSGRFTDSGRLFLDGLRAKQRELLAERTDPAAERAAKEAAQDHWIAWRLRNRIPEQSAVEKLAQAWQRGDAAAPLPVELSVRPAERAVLAYSVRLELARLRMTEPARFTAIQADAELRRELVPEASPGDLALAAEEHTTALAAYVNELKSGSPEGLGPWIGLFLAADRGAVEPLGPPEVCVAVYQTLAREGERPDPLVLARWLACVEVVAW